MLLPCVLLGAALFILGLIGFVTRRNLIIMFLCTELMFQGIILNVVAFGRQPLAGQPALDGQVFALFLIAVAAAEAAVALALVVLLYRYRDTLDAQAYRLLKDE